MIKQLQEDHRCPSWRKSVEHLRFTCQDMSMCRTRDPNQICSDSPQQRLSTEILYEIVFGRDVLFIGN